MSLFGASFKETKLLLEQGEDPNTKTNSGYTVLMNALGRFRFDIADILLDAGADIDAIIHNDGFTALMIASEKGYLEVVEYLVEHGADINAKDKAGNTALKIAIENNRIDVVKFLSTCFKKIVLDVPADYTCAICRCHDGKEVLQLPKCVHQFHTECITAWCKRVASCPMCRTPVTY